MTRGAPGAARPEARGHEGHTVRLRRSPIGQAIVVVLLAYVFTFLVISVLPGDPVTNTLRDPQNGFTEDEIQRIVAYYGLDQPVSWCSCGVAVPVRGRRPRCLAAVEPAGEPADRRGARLDAHPAPSRAGRRRWCWRSPSPTAPSTCRRYGRARCALPVAVPVGAQLRDRPAADPGLRLPARALPASSTPTARWATLLRRRRARHPGLGADGRGAHREPRPRVRPGVHRRGRAVPGPAEARAVLQHLLKPSSLPVVTVIALAVGELLGGSLITETIFGRTGSAASCSGRSPRRTCPCCRRSSRWRRGLRRREPGRRPRVPAARSARQTRRRATRERASPAADQSIRPTFRKR